MERLHKVKDNNVLARYRLFPYDEMVARLKKDGAIFFEDSKEQPLRPGTVWKASRKLTAMMGKPVAAQKGLLKLETGANLEGYLFSVKEPEVRPLKGKSS
jgi:hypothetical protein